MEPKKKVPKIHSEKIETMVKECKSMNEIKMFMKCRKQTLHLFLFANLLFA